MGPTSEDTTDARWILGHRSLPSAAGCACGHRGPTKSWSQTITALKNACRRAERRLRAGFRTLIGRVLTSGSVTRGIAPARLDPTSIRRVLVVRMNSRLGNTLAMTTLLTALHETMPGASIDMLTTYADADDLLHGIPGLDKVMVLSNRGWRRPGESLKVLRAYRATQYDLAIDPVPFSLGGRIALRLCRARWRLGFGGELSGSTSTLRPYCPRNSDIKCCVLSRCCSRLSATRSSGKVAHARRKQ